MGRKKKQNHNPWGSQDLEEKISGQIEEVKIKWIKESSLKQTKEAELNLPAR